MANLKMTVDVDVLGLGPSEMAKMFAGWDSRRQADFFAEAWEQMWEHCGNSHARAVQCAYIREEVGGAGARRDFLEELREPTEPERTYTVEYPNSEGQPRRTGLTADEVLDMNLEGCKIQETTMMPKLGDEKASPGFDSLPGLVTAKAEERIAHERTYGKPCPHEFETVNCRCTVILLKPKSWICLRCEATDKSYRLDTTTPMARGVFDGDELIGQATHMTTDGRVRVALTSGGAILLAMTVPHTGLRLPPMDEGDVSPSTAVSCATVDARGWTFKGSLEQALCAEGGSMVLTKIFDDTNVDGWIDSVRADPQASQHLILVGPDRLEGLIMPKEWPWLLRDKGGNNIGAVIRICNDANALVCLGYPAAWGHQDPNRHPLTTWRPATGAECAECFGTGFTGGFQSPCSKGCTP